jgi:succinate-semialdehyde dehydrogenase / glutarate-semialdehyde dehydrogenase
MSHRVDLFIDGAWCAASDGQTLPIKCPATEEVIGAVARASITDLNRALKAAASGFRAWRTVSAFERSKLLRRAATNLRSHVDAIAHYMVIEQGKPLFEATLEILTSADSIDWFAEEARRAYGRVIPSRAIGVSQIVVREPVGPVAAFTPWNFPVSQAVRKISAALAAGCSIIVKGPEETPISCAAMVKAFEDAGVPPGVVNLVYGIPAEISEHLIPHPVIRKVSFTGSTAVGKHLAGIAGNHMKRVTMELGGHSPAIVAADADIDQSAKVLATLKYRNAGQSCISPTRFLVHESVYDPFLNKFADAAAAIKVGDGLDPGTKMGPLANERRMHAMDRIIADALSKGGTLKLGGERIGNRGYFFAPTIIEGARADMAGMNEEPFGPLAFFSRFAALDEAIAEANRLDYGLAAYLHCSSAAAANRLAASLETGMVTINQFGLGLPEAPFGGVKDSGYGSEGGTEAIEAYLNTKFVSHAAYSAN